MKIRIRKIEMNPKNISFIAIIVVCVLSLSYGIYSIAFNNKEIKEIPEEVINTPSVAFDELFNNSVNLQDSKVVDYANKINHAKEIVYTTYTLNEIYEGKYEIHVEIPFININNEKVTKIDKEITSIFYDKVNSIIKESKEENSNKTIYTVSYTTYINENILSLAIRATLKEGDNPQRVIIKTYTYNMSTNEEIKLEEMLRIKGVSIEHAESEIKAKVQEAVNYANSLASLGYEAYKRNIKDDMYKVENSDNYFLGPNSNIYIIYAYGNSNYTSENDIVYIK